MGTQFEEFLRELDEQTAAEGKQAEEEMEVFRHYFRSQRTAIEKDLEKEHCLIEEFFRKEQEKPAHLRKNYCHISCPCSRCSPRM